MLYVSIFLIQMKSVDKVIIHQKIKKSKQSEWLPSEEIIIFK